MKKDRMLHQEWAEFLYFSSMVHLVFFNLVIPSSRKTVCLLSQGLGLSFA